MSYFLQKSNSNLAIAHYLYTDAPIPCYSASVHCSYYSCLQKIMYILKEFFEDNYVRINAEVKGKKGNTHKDYIIEIGNIIKDKSYIGRSERFKDVQNIQNYLIDLKELRIKADYHDIEIIKDKAAKAHQLAKDIHRIIKKHLKE